MPAKKIVLQLSKEDWRKAKNYRRSRNLKMKNQKPVYEVCPIAFCMQRNGFINPQVGVSFAASGGKVYNLNAHGIIAVGAFDGREKPVYGTVVLTPR